MGLIEAVLLGIVQGLTEFLPVSSSGHLVLLSSLLGVEEPTLVFDILLHFGTLVAVFIVFWSDIVSLVKGAWRIISQPNKWRRLAEDDPDARIVLSILLGTIPVVIVGFLLQDLVSKLFNAPVFAGYMLLITGTILFVSEKASKTQKAPDKITLQDGFIIGLGQAVAILPGISRSGTTIAVGLLRGLRREEVAKFSFLLSIPAILGSQVLGVVELLATESITTPYWIMAVGTLVSAITGFFAIKLLLQLVRKNRLLIFAYYTWFVGLIVVFLNWS